MGQLLHRQPRIREGFLAKAFIDTHRISTSYGASNVTVLLHCNAAAAHGSTVRADLILWFHLVLPTQLPFPAIFRTALGSPISDLDPNRAASDTYHTNNYTWKFTGSSRG